MFILTIGKIEKDDIRYQYGLIPLALQFRVLYFFD